MGGWWQMFRGAPILLSLALGGCGAGLCGNQNFEMVAAPDAKNVAIIFDRDCGATTSTSRQVSVQAEGSTEDGAGNLLIIDDDHENIPLTVTVRWISSHEIEISYPAKARIFKQKARVSGVDAIYRPIN